MALVERSPYALEGWTRQIECDQCACKLSFGKKDITVMPIMTTNQSMFSSYKPSYTNRIGFIVQCPECDVPIRLPQSIPLYNLFKNEKSKILGQQVNEDGKWVYDYYCNKNKYSYTINDVKTEAFGLYYILNPEYHSVYIDNFLTNLDKKQIDQLHPRSCIIS